MPFDPTFGRVSLYQNNPGTAAAPGIYDDASMGYGPGSFWLDTRYNIFWRCSDNTNGAAKWTALVGETLLGQIIGANMNVTTDQPFVMQVPLAGTTAIKMAFTRILVTNASLSLTTAAGGVYDTASKGGNAIVAAAQAYSGLTASGKLLSLTLASAGTTNVFSVAPILSLTTAQGAAATADFSLFGNILPG